MAKSKVKAVIQYLFFLALGFVLLWLSFRKLNINLLWQEIKHADYQWLLLALIFAVLSHITRAARWNLMINSMGYKTRLSTTFFAVMVGYMANTAVPRMGEFMRCGVLSKKENIPFNALFGTVISERLFDMLVLLLIIFLVVLFQIDVVGGFLGKIFEPSFHSISENITLLAILVLVVIISFILVLWLMYRFREKIKQLSFYSKLRLFIDGFWNGIKTVLKMKQKWLFLFYTFLIWLFYALMTWIPLKMFSETGNLTFFDGVTLLAVSSLGMVAPVPGGIGAYHIITKSFLFKVYGINQIVAGSFAAVNHAGQTLLNVFTGIVSYFLLGFLSKKQKPANE